MLSLVAPPMCLVCHGPAARGAALCPPCEAALPWIDDPCPRCALPRAACGSGAAACAARRASFATAYAPMAHVGVARDLLLALKLRDARAAADAMASQVLARARAEAFAGAVLVPVPARAAVRLAEALGRCTGRPVVRCLTRRAPRRQVGRGRGGRLERGPLEVAGRAPPAVGAVLVDDVHTTGATLESGATALERAGFLQIAAVTYVRTFTTA